MSRQFVSASAGSPFKVGRYVWRVPPDVRCIWRSLMVSLPSLGSPKKLSSRRKTPWKLSITRKANARARLKKVDAVIETVRASGIQCKALVSRTPYPLGLVVPAVLFRSRTAPCSCPRNMKWSQKINTPSLARLPVGIGRAFTKCLNGRGYVFLSSRMSAFLTMTT